VPARTAGSHVRLRKALHAFVVLARLFQSITRSLHSSAIVPTYCFSRHTWRRQRTTFRGFWRLDLRPESCLLLRLMAACLASGCALRPCTCSKNSTHYTLRIWFGEAISMMILLRQRRQGCYLLPVGLVLLLPLSI
jgi:hypothetical protein